MKDVSLEFAHLYAHDTFGPEQERSCRMAARIARGLGMRGMSVSGAILVDDLHSSGRPDVPLVASSASGMGAPVDAVVMEASLVPCALRLLDMIPSARTRVESFDRKRRRQSVLVRDEGGPLALCTLSAAPPVPTCATLTAAWHLLRLGVMEHGAFEARLRGRIAVTILPLSWTGNERAARDIVRLVAGESAALRLHHLFFDMGCHAGSTRNG